VTDGAIEGFQDPEHPGFGGYLVSEQAFGDVQLDTAGTASRSWWTTARRARCAASNGNGLAGFHAVGYVLDAVPGTHGAPPALPVKDPAHHAQAHNTGQARPACGGRRPDA